MENNISKLLLKSNNLSQPPLHSIQTAIPTPATNPPETETQTYSEREKISIPPTQNTYIPKH